MANIFKAYNKIEFANKHFLLLKIIREENKWKIPPELQNELAQINIENINQSTIKNELIKYWKSFEVKNNHVPKSKILLKGSIKKILNNNEKGKNGFLTSNQKDYYFLISKNVKLIDSVQPESKVEFEVINLDDGKERAKIIKVIM